MECLCPLDSSEGITSDPESLRFTYTPMENVKKKKDKDQPAHYRDQVCVCLSIKINIKFTNCHI